MRLFSNLRPSELVAARLAPLAYAALEPGEAPDVARQLRPHALASAAQDLALTATLLEVADRCTSKMLVIKGASTGLTHYADSAHRPRADVDVWVDGWPAAHNLAQSMVSAGYELLHQLPGRFARHAIALRRRDGVSVDVHARCSRRVRLERALPFDLVWSQRREIQLNGRALFAPADQHAWLLLAAHLTAHHAGQEFLGIHLEDLRRLGACIARSGWVEVCSIASQHELASALSTAIGEAEAWFPGIVPTWVLRELAEDDASAAFTSPILAILDDLELLEFADQATYLRELTYPPTDYLVRQLGVARTRPRGLLALHRAVEGIRRATLSRRSSTGAA